jgi:hypothetical protein
MINTQNHEEKHMPFADKPVIWTPSFLAGYRAFVHGGRDRTYDSSGKVRTASGGIEPYDYLTDQQKKEWRDAIQYAIGEREDCSGLCTPKTTDAEYYKQKEQEFIKMYKKNSRLYNYVYANALGVSPTFISKIKRKLKRHENN